MSELEEWEEKVENLRESVATARAHWAELDSVERQFVVGLERALYDYDHWDEYGVQAGPNLEEE